MYKIIAETTLISRIVASLNLYEFSMANNKEMGILIDKNDLTDTQLYEDAFKEVDYINETSQRFELSASKQPSKKQKEHKTLKEKTNSIQAKTQNGYCIRTGIEIPFNVEKPLSYEAYKVWNEFGDPNFPEKFCHFSGELSNGETSVSKPILKKNWEKAKELFDL